MPGDVHAKSKEANTASSSTKSEDDDDLPMNFLLFMSYGILFVVTIASNYVAVPVHVQLLLSATLPIYIASHNSLAVSTTETMKSEDVWKAPIVGSCALFGLYIVFTVLDPYWPNILLRAYFMIAGLVALQLSLRRFINPVFKKIGIAGKTHKVHWNENYIFEEIKFDFNMSDIVALLLSAAACAWYLQTKHWWGNNLFGIAFCIQAIENVSLGNYKNGAILLCGLFLYDIFWVFGTDVMVTVAMSFDAPIKLQFPRLSTEPDTSNQFSILGLGDIVIPGIFIALLLRFDRAQAQEAASTTEVGLEFRKTIFNPTIISYVLGLVTTVLVMYHFHAAQPALLYLVPFTLIVSFASAYFSGKTASLLKYDEEVEEESEKGEKEE